MLGSRKGFLRFMRHFYLKVLVPSSKIALDYFKVSMLIWQLSFDVEPKKGNHTVQPHSGEWVLLLEWVFNSSVKVVSLGWNNR